MATIEDLLARLADAARANEKTEFDRLELELLSHFDGGFDGMPEETYQRYLDVDRHWPISVEAPASARRRTLEIRLPSNDRLWLEELAIEADRSLSAVVARCLEEIRGDPELEARVRDALQGTRRTGA